MHFAAPLHGIAQCVGVMDGHGAEGRVVISGADSPLIVEPLGHILVEIVGVVIRLAVFDHRQRACGGLFGGIPEQSVHQLAVVEKIECGYLQITPVEVAEVADRLSVFKDFSGESSAF